MQSNFLYGINTAEEIFTAQRRNVLRLIISRSEKNSRINNLVNLARAAGVRPEFCDTKILDRLAEGGNHQGVVIEAAPAPKLTFEEALTRIKNGKKTIWAALDGITDPMNLGAIIRSAACLGVSVILLPERRSASASSAAVQKTASGAIEHVDIVEVVNLNQAILKLKKNNFWVYGLDMKGQKIHETNFSLPALIVVGAEGNGLHQKTRAHCDAIISIEQKGGVESLNAANAAAIAFYEASKKI